MKSEKIYLDYAASTPVDSRVLKAMEPYWSEKFGNPGSVHSFGQEALGAVDKARETIAKSIRCPSAGGFRQIIFTGSATEANNLVLRGLLESARHISRESGSLFAPAAKSSLDSRRVRSAGDQAERASETFRSKHAAPPKIIISSIEHESILQTATDMKNTGEIELVILPVKKDGIVDLKKLEEELDEKTILVSVMYVNNEIGSVQPITKISEIVRNFREELRIKNNESKNSQFNPPAGGHDSSFPLFHTDASQAFNYFDCDVNKLGIDLMTLSGQKIYGPKGIGMLYTRNQKQKTYNLKPFITGGGQEFGLRSGTENVPLIVGFAKAIELAKKERKENIKKVLGLSKYFWEGLKKFYPEAEINGIRNNELGITTPHILNVYFPTEFAGDLLVKLDMAGIAVSAGSACTARAYTPSYVLQSLGLSPERIRGSLRFSFGKNLSLSEIKTALKRIERIIR